MANICFADRNESGEPPQPKPLIAPNIKLTMYLDILAMKVVQESAEKMAQRLTANIPETSLTYPPYARANDIAAAIILKRALTEPEVFAAVQRSLQKERSLAADMIHADLAQLRQLLERRDPVPVKEAFQGALGRLETEAAAFKPLIDAICDGSRPLSSFNVIADRDKQQINPAIAASAVKFQQNPSAASFDNPLK